MEATAITLVKYSVWLLVVARMIHFLVVMSQTQSLLLHIGSLLTGAPLITLGMIHFSVVLSSFYLSHPSSF